MELRSERLRSVYPYVPFGIIRVQNFTATNKAKFDEIRQKELASLAPLFEEYQRESFIKTEPICHYIRYFRRFKKTYFVLQQIESVFTKNHPFPETIPAVQILLLTELKYGVLVAACDTDTMKEPFTLDVSVGGETFIGSHGEQITLKSGDIYLRDTEGIVISNIYGQDLRTRVTDKTENIMYAVMGVEGVQRSTIHAAMDSIHTYLSVLAGEGECTWDAIIE